MNKDDAEIRAVFESLKNDWCKISGNNISPLEYEDFLQFVYTYTVGIEGTYPLISKADEQFSPYIYLLHFSVAYNHFIYQKLVGLLKGDSIYPISMGQGERQPLNDLLILQLWRQKNFTTDNLVRSFCLGREFQAFQQLRMYIEICQLLFLLLTDQNALSQYLNQELDENQSRDNWWKHFAPSKTGKRILRNRQNVILDWKKKGILSFDVRLGQPGGFDFIRDLEKRCSDYVHWNKEAIFSHSFDSSRGGFRLNGTNDWGQNSKTSLINIIESLAHYTTWLVDALECHVILFTNSKNKQEMKECMINFLHSIFATSCAARGMYDFAQSQSQNDIGTEPNSLKDNLGQATGINRDQ